MQSSSLAYNKLCHGSNRSHHDERGLDGDFGCSPSANSFPRCLKGKSGFNGSGPNATIPGSGPYNVPSPKRGTVRYQALEDVLGAHSYCSQLEGAFTALERWCADFGVRSKHQKAFNQGAGSTFHRNLPQTKATLNQHQCITPSLATGTSGSASSLLQEIRLALQLQRLVLELRCCREMLEVETILSPARMEQYCVDDLGMEDSLEDYNNNYEQFMKARVAPADAGGMKNGKFSQRPLGTSGQHNQGSKDGNGEDIGDDGEDDRHGGESPGRNYRHLSETATPGRRFACPYQKRFSSRLPQNGSTRSFLGFPTVNLMK